MRLQETYTFGGERISSVLLDRRRGHWPKCQLALSLVSIMLSFLFPCRPGCGLLVLTGSGELGCSFSVFVVGFCGVYNLCQKEETLICSWLDKILKLLNRLLQIFCFYRDNHVLIIYLLIWRICCFFKVHYWICLVSDLYTTFVSELACNFTWFLNKSKITVT